MPADLTASLCLQVAVKWLPDIGSGPDVMQRFLQEINLLCHATLRCQRVCKVHGTCIKEERICIVMQLYKGSVAQLMAQQQGELCSLLAGRGCERQQLSKGVWWKLHAAFAG